MHPASTRARPTVLIAEDSAPIRELLSTVLRRGGFGVVGAADGEDALRAFYAHRPALVVLDLWMPKLDGWSVLQRIREFDDEVPILVLTGMDDENSKVRGLTWGADDYLVKPVGAAELLARAAALMRRARKRAYDRATEPLYDDGFVRVDYQRRTVTVAGKDVALSPLEFRLLAAFVQSGGELLTREDLLHRVWNDYSGGPSDHVKIYVGYVRRKLKQATPVELIHTVRGFGYRWSPPAVAAGRDSGHAATS